MAQVQTYIRLSQEMQRFPSPDGLRACSPQQNLDLETAMSQDRKARPQTPDWEKQLDDANDIVELEVHGALAAGQSGGNTFSKMRSIRRACEPRQ